MFVGRLLSVVLIAFILIDDLTCEETHYLASSKVGV